jgi:hypothetical protein
LMNFEREFDKIEAVDSQGGNEGRSITAFFLLVLLTGAFRRCSCPMEGEVQALPDSILCW